jgi:hypothetical protein
MENHVGAVWYFIHDYNAQQSKGLSRHHYYRITTNLSKRTPVLVGLYVKFYVRIQHFW